MSNALPTAPAPALTAGPITQYGAIYDQPAPHTTVARYASGSISEWYGPFDCELTKPIHLSDSFGRFDADRQIHQGPGRVFITRHTWRDADGSESVKYNVLSRRGIRSEIPAERAPEFLRCIREAGQLKPCKDDPAYQAAAERYSHMMSR